MAITTADQFFSAPKQTLLMRKPNITAGSQFFPTSTWGSAGIPAAGTLAVGNTTTGVLFDSTYTGAPTINAFGSGATGYLAAARMRCAAAGSFILYDRLWGAGAVSLTSLATTSFSSQPSYAARLPGTDYGNLEILIEITTTVSATATTVTVGYTNEAGTAGRTSGSTGSLSGIATPRMVVVPLQDGDKGVQTIDSVTVGGTVATAGAFNVIVGRRIAVLDIREISSIDAQAWDMLGMPQVYETSCLWLVSYSSLNQTQPVSMQLDIVNG